MTVSAVFNETKVFPDGWFTYAEWDIAKFLASYDSFLTMWKIGDQAFLGTLNVQCRMWNLNPKVILMSLERESGPFVRRKTPPSDRAMNRALGYAISDFQKADPKFSGFWMQVTSATKRYAQLIKEWKPGTSISVDNGMRRLVPENAETWALYRYTPWVGTVGYPQWQAQGVGITAVPYGAKLSWEVWKVFWPEDFKNGDKT